MAGKGRPKTGGRQKGALNILSNDAKEVIAGVAGKLGGMNRLVEWVKEDPLNERAFWVQVYPKLLPLTLAGDSENPLVINWPMTKPPLES
jgi:hypothetical protein